MQQKRQRRQRKGSFRKSTSFQQLQQRLQSAICPDEAQYLRHYVPDPVVKILHLAARVVLPPLCFARWAAGLYFKALFAIYSAIVKVVVMPVTIGKRVTKAVQGSDRARKERSSGTTTQAQRIPIDLGDGASGTELISQALRGLDGTSPYTTSYRTVTLKAKIDDPSTLDHIESALFQLTDSIGSVRLEEDVYFRVPEGQLKLRSVKKVGPRPSSLAEGGKDNGELVTYRQTNNLVGPNYSEARVTPVGSGMQCLRRTLGLAMEELGTLTKKRRSYSSGNFRANLDEVYGLGHFVDIDIQHSKGQSQEQMLEQAKRIQTELCLENHQLVPYSYLELHLLQNDHCSQFEHSNKTQSSVSSSDSGLGSNDDLTSLASLASVE